MSVPLTREELTKAALEHLVLYEPARAYYFIKSYARRNPNLFFAYTYFGTVRDGEPKIVNRRPVPWKGKKFGPLKDKTEEEAKKAAVAAGAPEGVGKGLLKAIDISVKAAGVKGVAAADVGAGYNVVIPAKVAKQIELAGKTPRYPLETYTNVVEALKAKGTFPIIIRPRTVLGLRT